MTVSSTVNREQYSTNGVTTAFTIHFPFFDDTDVHAVFVDGAGNATPLALNADYTVSGGGGAGGSLVTTLAPAGGGTLTLYRELAFTQEDDYVEDDPLPADTLEGGFDRAVMRDQQLKDASDRALTFPPTIPPGVSAELPNPSADKFLGWNAAADALENKSVPPGTVVYATVANTNAGLTQLEAVTPHGLANSNLALAVAAATAALALPALPTGYFQGFTLANNAGDAAHDIDVAAGKARSDDDAMNLATAATVVKQTDVAFAEYVAPGTASGGMDSTTPLGGGAATVHVFMIGGPGKNTQPFFSTAIGPSLPGGFTRKRYVGSLWWTGAAMEPFFNDGDSFTYLSKAAPAVNTTTLNTAGALTSALDRVPTGVKVDLSCMLALVNATAQGVLVSSPDQANVAVDVATPATYKWDLFAGTVTQTGYKRVRTDTSGRVRVRSSAASVTGFWLWVDGYRVFR